jgi:hypothetical protein
MYKLLRLLPILILLIITACQKENNNPHALWQENIGRRTDLPFLPDAQANYFGYSFNRKPLDKIGIRIKGQYPYARYMSYNVYDNSTRSSQASLVDTDIAANDGSVNPFTALYQPDTRNYTIYLLPDIPEAASYSNALLYNKNIRNVGTLLRYYVPEGNDYGNVPLPEIEAFDMETGARVILPDAQPINFDEFKSKATAFSGVIDLTQLMQAGAEQFFFRFSGSGLFQNVDNKYLFAPVRLGQNEVMMMRFIPPTYATGLGNIPDAEVRYYSLCLGDARTYNHVTRADFELKVASDGYIYVVIAREEPALITKAAGLNYLPWVPALKGEGLIIYRNMLTRPDYAFPMELVPDILQNIGSVFTPINLAGHTFLGDRAPVAVKMNKTDYLLDFGGFPVAY